MTDLRVNATFPWLLSRAVLPKLRRASGPTALVFVGSVSALLPLPGLIPYSPSKAFLRQLSSTLGADERFRTPSNVATLYLHVGSVVSGSHAVPATFFSPTAESFAAHAVRKIGCSRREAFAYWPHALQTYPTGLLPDSVLFWTVQTAAEEEFKMSKKA
jgi:17beta-estradiol 17-dehydrogenase / very-long-chain 3-oxoacyl-CoA reductase